MTTVVEGDGGGGGGGGGGEIEVEIQQKGKATEPQDVHDMIQGISDTIDFFRSFRDYRRTQKKECSSLLRRLKMLGPLLEELQEHQIPIPQEAYVCLGNLKKTFICAKKLLRTCHDGSKIYLAMESEAIMGKFHAIYDKLYQALHGMPYDVLEISEEVKEQVELMRGQLKRARTRTETQDFELAMDMMVVFSQKDDRNADSAIFERLAKKLELHTLADLRAETMAVKKLIKERCGNNADTTQQIIDLLNKFKEIAGIEDNNGLNDVCLPKYLEKSPSLIIPNDFLCPISLEIMTDPVIVATGQSYEKSSIQKWLDAGHRTCPKTRQSLVHLSLAPNYALRNLIIQWCEKNKVELLRKEACVSSENSEHEEEISSLVQKLSSTRLDVQREAVKKIRMLSKENPENRILVAKCGGISSLVNLLSYPDSKIKENSVTALLNLSIDEGNKKLIAREGAIPAIIDILKTGTVEAKENSAAALFSLSMLDENKLTIGLLNGIPPLVDLLRDGTIRGKKDAATALFNLSLNQSNKARAIEAGIVTPLLKVLTDKNLGMVDEALSLFLLLASHPDGRATIGQLSFSQTLVEFIKEGTPKNKECAVSVLFELGVHNSSTILAALQFGVYEHLCEVARTGTNRAQRKANSLLQHMRKCRQVS